MNQQLDELEGFKALDHAKPKHRGTTHKGTAKKSFAGSPTKGSSSTNVVFKRAKQTRTDESEGCRCRILKVPQGTVTEKDIIQIFRKMGRIASVQIFDKSWDVIFTKPEDALKCQQTFDGARISLDGDDSHASTIKTLIVKKPAPRPSNATAKPKTITVTLK